MSARQFILDIQPKLIVDLFAGGGGMSVAFEMAWGRSPDIAINHNDDALSMHRLNHPQTRHFIADVFEVCPRGATQGRPVGWLHLSPDCTDHSQAKGGQPRRQRIRALPWVGYRWAGQVLPDVISLENVKQILKWGPLIAKRDRATGRVVKLDGTVAAPGERVPVQQQYLIPDPKRSGQTWRRFVWALEALGYVVETRTICAADYGGHTTRERLWMIASRTRQPIVWPAATHFKKPAKGQKRWRPAADCIDWSIRCPSIFERTRPLADATMRRIARGIVRYVLESGDPFIVNMAHGGKLEPTNDPMSTIATERGGCRALVAPTLVQAAHGEGSGPTKRRGSGAHDIQEPLGTIHAGGGSFALASAYLMQANGGFNETPGRDAREPVSSITTTGSQQQVVTAFLLRQFGASIGHSADEPMGTVMAGGGGKTAVVAATIITNTSGHAATDLRGPTPTATTGQHHALVECTLSPEVAAGAERVAAFLMRYYGEGGQWSDLRDPMTTVTTKDRMALVTVTIKGTPYVIVDIGLRMLEPRELFRAQDFPESYIIDRGHDGRVFSKSAQVRMCGNSVDPLMAVDFLRANAPGMAVRRVA